MQKIALTLLCVSMLILPGCQQDERVGVFDVVQVVEFTVPAGLNVVETHFFQLSNVNSSFDDQLEATGFESSDIASVEPRYCEVRTVFDDIDLDFVRAIEVHLFDPFLAQSQREVFYLDPVPGNTKNVIRPFPGLQNIKELLDNPTVGVEVRVRFFRPPPTTFSFRVDLEFTAFTD